MEQLFVADSVRTGDGIGGDALLVRDGAVIAVGSVAALSRHDSPRVHHTGGVIVPGLRDAHFHPATYAAALAHVSLKTATDFAEIAARLKAAASGRADGTLLSALRLDDESLGERRLPTRVDLDAMVDDRPVLVHRYCGHIAVANSAALELAGIDRDTLDPQGGSFDREDGYPNGILRETAVKVVTAAISAPPAVGPDDLCAAMGRLAGLGITSMGAMVTPGTGGWGEVGDEVELVAAAAPGLPIRLHCFVAASTIEELDRAADLLAGAGPRVRWAGLKMFGDGSLGGHTAAMHEPFADRPGERGTLRLDPDRAHTLARRAVDRGGRVAIHAIGDRANAVVLGVMERLVGEGVDPDRLRVEHASVLGPDEIRRLTDLGVTASVQPAFLASETAWLEKRVGDRIRTTYPFRTLLEAGVPLAGGSDCPVEPPSPLWGMAAARDRAGIVPAEGLEAEDAFALFTDWAAASLGELPPLSAGSPADFVVLDRDPVEATPAELRSVSVVATYVDGARVEPIAGPVWPD